MVQRVKKKKNNTGIKFSDSIFHSYSYIRQNPYPRTFFLSSFLITNIINDMNNKKKGLPINNHTIIIIIIIIFMGIILLLINSS